MNLSKLFNNEGMSLLEVMVGMLLLGFGLVGLAPMLILSIEGNVVSRDNAIAANLMKEKVEYYESLDSLPSLPFRETEAGLDSVYTRSTYIRDNVTDTLIPSGLCQIDVQVSWVDHQALQRLSTYSTFIITN